MTKIEIQEKLDQLQTVFPAYSSSKTKMNGPVPLDLKKRILELLAAKVGPPLIARKTNIPISTLYKWRKDLIRATTSFQKTVKSNELKPKQLKIEPASPKSEISESSVLAKIRFQSGISIELPVSVLDIQFLSQIKSLE